MGLDVAWGVVGLGRWVQRGVGLVVTRVVSGVGIGHLHLRLWMVASGVVGGAARTCCGVVSRLGCSTAGWGGWRYRLGGEGDEEWWVVRLRRVRVGGE